MAKPLQSVTIQEAGFYGLNTQDSPTALTEQFALQADNCVIDRFGRIGARKGYRYLNTSPEPVVSLYEHIKSDGTSVILSSTASDLYEGTETLTSIKPTGYTVSDGLFQYATLNNITYIFREGVPPLYFDGTTCDLVENNPDYSGTVPQGQVAISSYGRLWAVENNILYWSDLFIGFAWDTGSAGSLDVSKVWASGSDEITGLAAHNGFLFIFGKRQILIYQGPQDPATMSLADTIGGLGCLEQKTIQNTGNDLIFLSEIGVTSINRVIQEKSAPLSDLSKNVRSELTAYLNAGNLYDSLYNPEEAFYLLNLRGSGVIYVFDMRGTLQDGSRRVTKWTGINPSALLHSTVDNKIYLGKDTGFAEYRGYLDDVSKENEGGTAYRMAYFTNYIDFGAPSNLKMLKNLKITFIGGSDTQVILNYGYDYDFSYKKRAFVLPLQRIAEYGIAEYGIGEYNQGILVNRPSINASSGGSVVQLGVEVTINGSPISVQRITAQAIVGRVI